MTSCPPVSYAHAMVIVVLRPGTLVPGGGRAGTDALRPVQRHGAWHELLFGVRKSVLCGVRCCAVSRNGVSQRDDTALDAPLIVECVQVHSGSTFGGHYYAYIRSFENGKW
eukprot:2805800-Rhodomonas_salina.5